MKNYIYIAFSLLLVIALWSCSEVPQFVTPIPESKGISSKDGIIYNVEHPIEKQTFVDKDQALNFVIELSDITDSGETILLRDLSELEKIVKEYNEFKSAGKAYAEDYFLLPSVNFEFEGFDIKKGESKAEASLQIKDIASEELKYGDYILPLYLKAEDKEFIHMIFIRKDGEYVSISNENPKPLPPAGYDCPKRTEPMKMVAYVETNNYDIRNYGQLILKESKKPVFDFVILFAANMNYNAETGKRYIFFNDKLQPIVKNPEKYIKPLTDRGIKVLIDILPNHQGVGFANFQNYEEAKEFAEELKIWTEKLGIDGWDIDEEYADYENLPSKPRKGKESFLWFMKAMKEVMPDKLLTLYDYGHGIYDYTNSGNDTNEDRARDFIDWSWANYGEDHGSYIGLSDEKYGKLSVEANRNPNLHYIGSVAQSNLADCFGLMMFFNINPKIFYNPIVISNLSQATQLFYGEDCEFVGKYHKGPND